MLATELNFEVYFNASSVSKLKGAILESENGFCVFLAKSKKGS